ncbi:sodium/hydrogen exchanger [Hymenobacter roseosalivarius DSM 11622]|uniref:Sodium/hydrogen exchanger n=1 Tax=Hymenobacter roseosalivarius DSM 11622 TaxID=645990 RepID=A0A1W1VYM3_9BACT|nr:cation:proton antiporter [Hymenobacter roseosalivarius]SMB97944.1 sodium/hydrogen exchanger [Hymenobacter roseosalivarius DSM 11622]
MITPVLIIFIGFLIFFGHYLAEMFDRTRIPDVVGLLLVGILIGPVFHLIDPASFGQAGRVFTNIVLVFILFESGLEVRFEQLKSALRGTVTLTTLNFIVTTMLVAAMAQLFAGLDFLSSVILGSILGGTSSAVVTTLARKVDIQEQTSTTLVMESAFSDVYTLAIPISLISLYTGASFSLGSMFGQIFTSLVLAVVAGVATGYLWSILLTKVPTLLKTRFSTPAFVFIVYGLVELLNFSGPIAVLFFSITLGNVTLLRPRLLYRYLPTRHIELTAAEKGFFSEMVFLLRTFFFVYVGMSIVLDNAYLIGLGAAITVLLFLVRIPVVLASADTKTPLFDTAFMSIMIPKGLGAAVLATLPAQRGLPSGPAIQTITFAVIIFTTVFCTLLFFVLEKRKLLGFYRLFFGTQRPLDAATAAAMQPAESSSTVGGRP